MRLISRENASRYALCLVCLLAACGRNQTAPVSDGAENAAIQKSGAADAALNLQIEQKLDPLTREDVELYLKVMRAAADRVKNPTAADRATLTDARAILTRRPDKPTPDNANTLERATLISTGMDQIVAEEMKLDGRAYRGIAEAVEGVVPNPTLALPSAASASDPAQTPLQLRLREVNAANQAFLASYRKEIQGLVATVRNPANVPR